MVCDCDREARASKAGFPSGAWEPVETSAAWEPLPCNRVLVGVLLVPKLRLGTDNRKL